MDRMTLEKPFTDQAGPMAYRSREMMLGQANDHQSKLNIMVILFIYLLKNKMMQLDLQGSC